MDRQGNILGTYNSGKFWVTDPRAEDVDIEAVSHALAHNCRFNGHTDFFWTVAQHSLLVSDILLVEDIFPKEQRHLASLIGLLHDGSEGYCSDISSPFKHLLTQYLSMEDGVQNAIFEACGVDYSTISGTMKKGVKEADLISLAVEAKLLMNPCKEWAEFGNFNDPILDKWEQCIKLENPQVVQGKILVRLYHLLHKTNLFNKANIFKDIGVDWAYRDESILPIFDKGSCVCFVREDKKGHYLVSKSKLFKEWQTIPKPIIDNAQSMLYLLSQGNIA